MMAMKISEVGTAAKGAQTVACVFFLTALLLLFVLSAEHLEKVWWRGSSVLIPLDRV